MRIVMTGATAGFGLDAAERLVEAGHALVVGARNPRGLPASLAGRVDARALDLDRFASVREFAASLEGRGPIDALVLNAGLQRSRPETGAESFERTFAVNHLAHFLLLDLVQPLLAPSGRVVLTGSGTHDPEEGTPVTPPVHANAEWLAFPDRDPTAERSVRKAAFRAYSSSKLANIMTAREAARRYPHLSVMSYDPGYVPWTGLGRANGRVLSALASMVVPLLIKKDRSSTIPRSGAFLAALACDDRYAGCRGEYFSVRGTELKRLDPSVLARDDEACRALWDDSARLLGMGRTGIGRGA